MHVWNLNTNCCTTEAHNSSNDEEMTGEQEGVEVKR